MNKRNTMAVLVQLPVVAANFSAQINTTTIESYYAVHTSVVVAMAVKVNNAIYRPRGYGTIHTLLDIGAICNMLMTYDGTFEYLFDKYRIAGISRASPVQKRSISRNSVSIQSYTTNAGNHELR